MKEASKKSVLDIIFKLIQEGKNKKEIKEKLGIKKNNLCNQLRRLENLGAIRREGKFVIKILNQNLPSTLLHPGVTINKVQIKGGGVKRGHAHNFKVYFHKKVNLKELPKIKQDASLGIFQRLPFGSLKFIKKGFTIWINSHNLTIYSNNSYYSKNALHSKFIALRSVDNLIQNLILKYNLPDNYGIEIFREHYGLIFNAFAKWLNKKGRKMYVEDKKGKTILWVDKSRKDDIGLDEFEGEDPLIINNADTFFKSHEKHGFKVDADFTLNGFQTLTKASVQNAKNLNDYAVHLKAHVESVKQLGNAVQELTKVVKDLKKDD